MLETHRLEIDNGAVAEELAEWVHQDQPAFDWRQYGFQEFSELLNYAQDKGLVRIQADEEKGLIVYLGAEFHPPAPPPEPEPVAEVEEEEEDEPQPLVPGQPTATGEIPLPELPPKPQRRPRAPRKTASVEGQKKRASSRARARNRRFNAVPTWAGWDRLRPGLSRMSPPCTAAQIAFAAFLLAWFLYFTHGGLRVHFAVDDIGNMAHYFRGGRSRWPSRSSPCGAAIIAPWAACSTFPS